MQFALIYSYGLVNRWTSAGQSVAYCPMDVTWFPMDSQNCPLVYESWAMPSAQLNITQLGVDLFYYQTSGEWHLAGNNRNAAFMRVNIPLMTLLA